MNKPYLIAQILFERGMPELVIKEITALDENELQFLKMYYSRKKRINGY
jgi:hypothetical protein